MDYRVEVPVWHERRDQGCFYTEEFARQAARKISALTPTLVVQVWSFSTDSYVARYVGGERQW